MQFEVTGQLLIGGEDVRGAAAQGPMQASPFIAALSPTFLGADASQVERACRTAASAADPFAARSLDERAHLLDAIATNLSEPNLVGLERLSAEAGISPAAAHHELARCVARVRRYAHLLRGRRRTATRLDPRDVVEPARSQAFVRAMHHRPLGPVAVFCADEHPFSALALSESVVAALAAGCPVVVRGCDAHPGTCELQLRAVRAAVAGLGMPEGVVSLLYGVGVDERLVEHPAIRGAVVIGGRAASTSVVQVLQRRAETIPVFIEQAQANPIFVLPDALNAQAEAFARDCVERLATSRTSLGDKPAIVVAIDGDGFVEFREALAMSVSRLEPIPSSGAEKYGESVFEGRHALADRRVAEGATAGGDGKTTLAQAVLYEVSACEFLARRADVDGLAGPAVVLVRCPGVTPFVDVARSLSGTSSSTLFMSMLDAEVARELVAVLAMRTERIIVRQPASRAVAARPSEDTWPSTFSDEIDRFVRPVGFHGVPDELLPPMFVTTSG